MAVVWMILIVVGLAGAVLASRRAVTHASALAFGLRIPPFLVGITLVAIGTDLPEIANSIAASISGNGDLNVGDSVGSAATQVTLVLGLAPMAGGAFVAGGRRVAWVGGLTAAALAVGAILFADGFLGRPLAATIAYLSLVGVFATGAVLGFEHISTILGIPQYIIAFFVASIGTSLPELVVSVSALRQGARDLAVGDLFGASLSDASLSIASGPLIAPSAISGALVVRGSVVAFVAVVIVTIIVGMARRIDWKIGLIFLVLYAGFYVALLA
jgi:cation:H+ antiporter